VLENIFAQENTITEDKLRDSISTCLSYFHHVLSNSVFLNHLPNLKYV